MIIDLLFAFLIALVASLILAALFRGNGKKRAGAASVFFFLFFLMLLATWAGGIWIAPVGPVLWGGYWLGFVITGIIVALLIAALAPPPPGAPKENVTRIREEETASLTLGIFFWFALATMAIAIAVRYA